MKATTDRREADRPEPEGPDRLRPQLHAMWADVAGAWDEHADYADDRGAAVGAAMLDWAAPRSGERVLELACGPGGLGLAAASRVGATGEVVLSDVVLQMTAIAAARAEARGLTNVRTLVLDLERIEQPDAEYDVVLCREGLMFALDPACAVGEIGRVLRPGGRVAVAVWGPREQNPWLALVLDGLGAELGVPIPPPGIPGPFSLGRAEDLVALLAQAEFVDVAVTEVPVPLRVSSFDEWWRRTTALAGPVAKLIAPLPEETVTSLSANVRESVRPYETPTGLEIPGVSLLATGRRP